MLVSSMDLCVHSPKVAGKICAAPSCPCCNLVLVPTLLLEIKMRVSPVLVSLPIQILL